MSIAALLALTLLGTGEIATLKDATQLADRIVQLINQDDPAELSKMALPEFFERIPAEQFPGLVHQLHQMGHLSTPALIADFGEQRKYKVVITKDGQPDRAIVVVLGAQSASSFYELGMQLLRERTTSTQVLKGDNPGRGELDKQVGEAVEEYVLAHHVDGLSIGVISNGTAHKYNYGVSRPSLPTTSSTVYEIGSVTKTMTGYILARAVRENRLSLDDDIRSQLPSHFPHLEFDGQPVTFRHLATHTSGLPPNPPGIPDEAGAQAYKAYSHEQLLADLKLITLTRKPGTSFSYSNMGAGLCGLALERAFHKPYASLLRKFLFDPLGMSSSGLTTSSAMESQYADPHDAKGQKTDRWTVNGIEAAGAVRSTLNDMVKYADFNLTSQDPALAIQHKQQSKKTTPKMGLFWLIGNSRLGGPYFKHEGGTGGFTCHVLIVPQKRLAVAVMMNTGEQNAGDLAYNIALRYLWQSTPHIELN